MCEGTFRQYERGLVDIGSWRPLRDFCLAMLENDVIRYWWDQEQSPLSESFRIHLNTERASAVTPHKLPVARTPADVT